ncbi:hypothetical protein LTR10_020627 [Elasticomyces elasticus]|uniref:Arginase n=1 Tax=Exophiala sideris TaxID=1016849 RepID=A0ABR0JPE3_9EURO|nr:hypothetical protein LTR10_020627 [Elasticomyces elasticus]KAK5038344.1 hypothetical protein LTS07_001814 [Exophiala sideris]KAK5044328.1 hypothetical protein LTR13_000684 [Exophiala sideris]KAK5067828.1 hypothetical protein LTR69_001817 [Exophiala sideris]KAK5183930.1 hypothetical protein LTR44_003435 [Eurotiomycetes sp. CCFEE 6388]
MPKDVTNGKLKSVTVIFSPYHVGIRDHAVGAGPGRLRNSGLVSAIRKLDVEVHEVEIERVYDAEGDIGRSFEVIRRIARAVTAARDAESFPIVIAGNCSATVGVLAGLSGSEAIAERELGCIWFDSHDDFNVPDTVLSGYFDSMGVAIMAGQCWKTLAGSVPGFRPLRLERFVHVGMRDVNELEKKRVKEAGYDVVWGNEQDKVDFRSELERVVGRKREMAVDGGWTMVHVDLDCLDGSVARVNKYGGTKGGLMGQDLSGCLDLLGRGGQGKVMPMSLTIASYDPEYDESGRVAGIAVEAVEGFVRALKETGALEGG